MITLSCFNVDPIGNVTLKMKDERVVIFKETITQIKVMLLVSLT